MEKLQKNISRREMIKTAGVLSLGLLYTKPFVESIRAKPAFNGYEPGGDSNLRGLTPGYWKQDHHYDDWTDYTPEHKYKDVFGVEPTFGDDITLSEALRQGGGGEKALGRHAAAALLNAANPDVNYAYTEAEIIKIVQVAYETGDFEAAKDLLEAQNELH